MSKGCCFPTCLGWSPAIRSPRRFATACARRGRPALVYLRATARTGLIGGACSFAAYGIVLWAMTRAPIAAIAALRETSVLFAAIMGSLWLKEGFGWRRVAGAASVVAGIAALKLG